MLVDRVLGTAQRANLPPELEEEARRAVRLELWTIFFLVTIVIVMFFTMGSSQAMKTAWIEDALSLLPPILFLVAIRLERRQPNPAFPFGYHRFGSLAFFAAACALAAMGGYLLYEAVVTLIRQEHPTIGSVQILGRDIWLGWLMMAALAYSVVPPVILGRMKRRPAHRLADKILHTDSQMNAADWQTGVAGMAGIAGIAFGFWWADAAAAGIISFSILKDGFDNVRIAFAELLDGAPRKLDSSDTHPAAEKIRNELQRRYPGREVRVRETGRHMRAVIVPGLAAELNRELRDELAGSKDGWRLIEASRALDDAAG
ncbi:cation diffusion facilitator family transporter [Oricola cellulosilytica]|uniref:Cation diffusion facilitator family transporter n=1 Tax=Oricola cellulosilytica TaxID=1429082 RepID=A0A4R0PEW8_9HYPH|nr:cation diffusion facilitator family transporter [Oricola cellulosilytica]TCD15188.1 cation diffusion facilitator family transporter [Oricola cellulosilytica]